MSLLIIVAVILIISVSGLSTMKTSPKDFFLTGATVAALYASLVSLITLAFEYIDRLVGNPFEYGYYDPYSGGIRVALSTLIVIFPLFIYFTRVLNQDIRTNPEKKDLWVRKWLLMLTVFLAGLTIVIDLIVLLNTFLGGEELTIAFLLKVFTVLVVAGGVLWYYLKDIKGHWEANERTSVRIGQGVVLAVVALVIAGFFIMGSPAEQRKLRYDNERINALQSIQYMITDYYRNKQMLPESLDVLEDPLMGNHVPVDPETGESYTYNKTEALRFELCATFAKESLKDASAKAQASTYVQPELDTNWQHDAGEVCFERTIDPDNYQPYGKEVPPTVVR